MDDRKVQDDSLPRKTNGDIPTLKQSHTSQVLVYLKHKEDGESRGRGRIRPDKKLGNSS